MSLRIIVLSGWFGRPLNFGMGILSSRLSQYGESSFHGWRDVGAIAQIVNTLPLDRKLVIIGFSLGANDLGLLGHMARRRIQLGVAYDPSRRSPLVRYDTAIGEYVQEAPNYDKLLCFYHPDAMGFGGSKYIGKNVETQFVTGAHLLMQFRDDLHQRTISEVAKLAARS